MVGPSIDSLGGISRVVKIWKDNGLFEKHRISYFPTTTDSNVNNYLFFIKNFFLYFTKLLFNKNLVYVHTSSYKSFYRKAFFLLAAILFKRKIILHIHPSHFYDFLNQLNGLPKTFVNFILLRVYGFVFLTEDMLVKFRSIFPEKSMWILRNPVDIKAMKNNKGYIRKDNNLLFLGWFIKEKGIFELVDATKILCDRGYKVKLCFCGTKKIDQLRDYVQNKKLESVIQVHGWIDGEEKLKKLYESTLLILPSYSEGIPNVILEAMATKTPIISTLVGGLKEVLVDGRNAIIVQPKEPIDLAEKIALCLKDKSLREKIANNAFDDVKRKYDISIIKRNFEQILNDI